MIFDYEYKLGKGVLQVSILGIRLTPNRLPNFQLQPKTFWRQIAILLGVKDIYFTNDPLFSDHYWLSGTEQTAIRNLFTDEVRTFYKCHDGLCTQVINDKFFCYKLVDGYGQRISPQQIYMILKEGLDILILLLDTAKAQPPKISMNGLPEHRRKFYPAI
jgi:hypothetical protein